MCVRALFTHGRFRAAVSSVLLTLQRRHHPDGLRQRLPVGVQATHDADGSLPGDRTRAPAGSNTLRGRQQHHPTLPHARDC